MNPNTNPPVDEVGRVVIHLPDDAMLYRERTYLPVALDLVDGSTVPSRLRSGEQGINDMAQSEVFLDLCSGRAQRTVYQTLRVRGAPVTPER